MTFNANCGGPSKHHLAPGCQKKTAALDYRLCHAAWSLISSVATREALHFFARIPNKLC